MTNTLQSQSKYCACACYLLCSKRKQITTFTIHLLIICKCGILNIFNMNLLILQNQQNIIFALIMLPECSLNLRWHKFMSNTLAIANIYDNVVLFQIFNASKNITTMIDQLHFYTSRLVYIFSLRLFSCYITKYPQLSCFELYFF